MADQTNEPKPRVHSFRVEDVAGVRLLYGQIPMDDITHLTARLPKGAVIDMRLTRYTGATFATGLREDCDRVFRERLIPPCADIAFQVLEARKRGLPESAGQWLEACDRGASSDTIFSHLAGFDVTQSRRQSLPLDADDFTRCRRLLEQVPEFAARIEELRTISPGWSRLVDEWGDICAVMDAEAPQWREKRGNSPAATKKLSAIAEARL